MFFKKNLLTGCFVALLLAVAIPGVVSTLGSSLGLLAKEALNGPPSPLVRIRLNGLIRNIKALISNLEEPLRGLYKNMECKTADYPNCKMDAKLQSLNVTICDQHIQKPVIKYKQLSCWSEDLIVKSENLITYHFQVLKTLNNVERKSKEYQRLSTTNDAIKTILKHTLKFKEKLDTLHSNLVVFEHMNERLRSEMTMNRDFISQVIDEAKKLKNDDLEDSCKEIDNYMRRSMHDYNFVFQKCGKFSAKIPSMKRFADKYALDAEKLSYVL